MDSLKPKIHERAVKIESDMLKCLSVNSKQVDIARLLSKSEAAISKIKDNETKLSMSEWALIIAHGEMELSDRDAIHIDPEELYAAEIAAAKYYQLRIDLRASQKRGD